MTRTELLELAGRAINQDRQTQHGSPERNFTRIAEFWSVYTGAIITPADVSVMMCLLKISRIRHRSEYIDNWVDLVGYAACGGEIAIKDDSIHQKC